jgi:hypothetical protein
LHKETVDREIGTGWGQSGRRTIPPDGDVLDGYAYEKIGSEWRLTPFGHGLLELYQKPSKGVRWA